MSSPNLSIQQPLSREPVLLTGGLLLSILVLGGSIGYSAWSATGQHPTHDPTGVLSAATWLLTGLMILANCRWWALLALALIARHRRSAVPTVKDPLPYVSILVPCYNEGRTIEAALRSLLDLDYPTYEIIVVNDGSADDTLAQAKRFEGRWGDCTVRVFDKPNGGKWSAHNLGFQNCRGELIVFVDADSRLDPMALNKLVAHLADPHVDGVAGQVRVRNRTNLITRLQGLEYLITNGAVRLAQGLFGTVLIVPGPIGMFRRSALEEVWMKHATRREAGGPGDVEGPLSCDTFAEDFDLSLSLLSLGKRIVYEPAAISYTRAPETHFALINQRYRWIRGNLQVLRKFFRRAKDNRAVLSPRLVGWMVATCAMDLLLMPLLYYLGLALFLILVVAGGTSALLAGTLALFLAVSFTAGAFFVSVHRDSQRLLAMLPLLSLYNGLVLNSAWIISVLDEFRGRAMRW